MYQLSYWEQASFFSRIDFLVVGSGIVGLSAALHLKEQAPKATVVIVDRGPLPIGASTRNAGFACFGSVSELLDDMQHLPEDQVWQIVERRWKGLQRLRQRLGDQQLQYRAWGGYELFQADEASNFEQCAEQLPHFNQRLAELTGRPDTYQIASDKIANFGLRGVQHLIWNTAEGQIHTGEMMRGLLEMARAAGVQQYAGVTISHIEDQSPQGVQVYTKQSWPIHASKVIVATNGFARQLLPETEVQPARNQVLITKPIPHLPIRGCFHYDRGYYYFRNIDGRLLLGGGRHLDTEGETTDQFGNNPAIRRALIELLSTVILPGRTVDIDRWWTGILGLGPTKAPILKTVSPNVVAAVRLGGMGVAIGSLLGEEAAVLALEG
ncbi:MAG TPA: FAD-dependent oxidoreductase [Phaeodactylibacter sp.]|nr:FAD-dependent oxidoreductase [Phaeodactylibacter sp.]